MTVPQAFALAVQYHQAGRLAEAESLYRQILAAQPDHAGAIQYLGVIFHQAGRDDLALEWLQRAITLDPNDPAAHSNLGEAYRTSGRLDEAIAAFHRALQLNANFPDAHNNLGIVLAAQRRHEQAIVCYRRALELRPSFAEAQNNLGIALAGLNQYHEAIASYRRAIELKPGYAEAYYNLGIALTGCGRWEEAIVNYRYAIQCKPDHPGAHYNLGNALQKRGQRDEAVAAYRRALQFKSDYAEALNNLGHALTQMGRLNEAVATLERALASNPKYVEAHYNLGIALHRSGRPDGAAAAYHRALEIKPDHAEAHNNLGNALMAQGRLAEAIAAYREAARLQSGNANFHSNIIFALHFDPEQNKEAIRDAQRRWNQQIGEPRPRLLHPPANNRDADRQLRVGYVSPYFREHVIGLNLRPLFRHHHPEGIEIFCYSGVVQPDALTQEFRERAAHWRCTVGVTDDGLAEMIRRDGVDILVDLSQHAAGNRLPVFARRPAPVQVSFAGYPESTGLEAIEYRISDRWLEGSAECGMQNAESRAEAAEAAEFRIPNSAIRIPERVFLLDSFWCYDARDVRIENQPPPARQNGHVTFGSLNNFSKLNEPTLRLWARILEGVEYARLMLLCPSDSRREQTLEHLRSAGLSAHQVEFVEPRPRQDYLELYHLLDVVLDTFPYNGHTSSLDALWMGVPVVSLAGQTSVARGGLSILSNLGLPELVAHSPEEYVRIATELAQDLPRLAELRAGLRDRMEKSVLMDAPHFTRQVEAAYRAMWRQWCSKTEKAG